MKHTIKSDESGHLWVVSDFSTSVKFVSFLRKYILSIHMYSDLFDKCFSLKPKCDWNLQQSSQKKCLSGSEIKACSLNHNLKTENVDSRCQWIPFILSVRWFKNMFNIRELSTKSTSC